MLDWQPYSGQKFTIRQWLALFDVYQVIIKDEIQCMVVIARFALKPGLFHRQNGRSGAVLSALLRATTDHGRENDYQQPTRHSHKNFCSTNHQGQNMARISREWRSPEPQSRPNVPSFKTMVRRKAPPAQ